MLSHPPYSLGPVISPASAILTAEADVNPSVGLPHSSSSLARSKHSSCLLALPSFLSCRETEVMFDTSNALHHWLRLVQLHSVI